MSTSFDSLLKNDKKRRQNLIERKRRLQRQEQKKAMTGVTGRHAYIKPGQKTEVCGATAISAHRINSTSKKRNSCGKQKVTSVTKNETGADKNQPIIHIDQPETNNGHQSIEHGGHLHVDENISKQEPDLMKPASNPGHQIENRTIESRAEQDRHKTTEDVTSTVPLPLSKEVKCNESRVHVRGLQNLGNTCYMNAALQCLRSVTSFCRYMSSIEENISNDRLVTELVKLFKKMGDPDMSAVLPRDIKVEVGKRFNHFRGTAQQDSQEFLTFLLSNMHETLKQQPKTSQNNFATDAMSEQAWNEHLEQGDSIVVQEFHGQLKSILTCSSCKEEQGLDTFDAFMSLPLSIPGTTDKVIELSQCFETMCQAQLSTSKNWYCDKCGVMVYLSKQTIISLPPRTLIVYLKRFCATMHGTVKVNTEINFPIEMELSSFTSNVPCKYKLCSVINHYGSIQGGHYNAISRHGDHWYLCDDAHVILLQESEVVTHQAFILFYELLNR